MKRFLAVTAIAFILAVSGAFTAQAGKIVLTNDEWTLSYAGFSGANDPGLFALNVAKWFTGSTSGSSFLVYSSNFGLTGVDLASVMTGAGNTWTVSNAVPQSLATLQNYDAVFLAGDAFDNSVLIDYVNGGGNVFLEGGTGWAGGAAGEAAQWNAFLNAFGLGFGNVYNGVGGDIAISSTHPIFTNVDHLYQDNGNDALDINASDPNAQVLISFNGHGLYAVYESVSVPEPGTLLLLGGALIGLFGLRRKVGA